MCNLQRPRGGDDREMRKSLHLMMGILIALNFADLILTAMILQARPESEANPIAAGLYDFMGISGLIFGKIIIFIFILMYFPMLNKMSTKACKWMLIISNILYACIVINNCMNWVKL
jgi:hypothetical protein